MRSPANDRRDSRYCVRSQQINDRRPLNGRRYSEKDTTSFDGCWDRSQSQRENPHLMGWDDKRSVYDIACKEFLTVCNELGVFLGVVDEHSEQLIMA